MRVFKRAVVLSFAMLVAAFSTAAQESDVKVVDEVVAQVNDGVITLSKIKREMKLAVDSLVQEGKKRDEAQKIVEGKRGDLIANLINEELMMQRGKELGVEQDVEASLNSRFLQIMKQYNLKTLDQLYEEMQKQGIDPQELKDNWRRQATRDEVFRREVQSKVYWAPTPTELKEYYEKNKSKFAKPEKVTLSEIFLSFAGRDEAAVREKARQLVAQLRAGADFTKAVLDNSDRPGAAESKGKVDTFTVNDLDDKYKKALAGVKVGGYTDPIEVDGLGVNILRVDERIDASSESVFDESAVRLAILNEKAPSETKKFMSKLREEAYIKISESYRAEVSPILFADERTAKNDTKKSSN
ncbi:MAG: peptidyl-prolyl cis-trans isomerase [Pyrinomonadaceae bacterium]